MEIQLRVTLDTILKERGITQKDLIQLIKEKTGKDVRAASISELYNNQRKTLNKDLINLIANTLEIKEVNDLIRFVEK
ncbi:helix-turn-helix domain-containing protein [Bacillus sp. SM2101]|uniref:helix-turn-helix domain-containing protein n=1 Tax=Bacillus sp. SM2101 TaxID=2805366 RepID=UPI003325F590